MYKYIRDKSDLKIGEFFNTLGENLLISIDTEATSLDPITAEWILLQVKLGEDIYLFDARTLERKFLTYIVDLLNSSGKPVIGHNLKYDLKIIYVGTGVLLKNLHDTMIIESLIYRGIGKVFYSLEELVELYTGEQLSKEVRSSFINLVGDLSTEQLAYSAMDVIYLDTIYKEQRNLIEEMGMDLIYKLEMDLIPVLVGMELTGVYLDKDKWILLKNSAISSMDLKRERILNIISSKIDYTKYPSGYELAKYLKIPIKTKRDRLLLESIFDPLILKGWVIENFNINSNKQLKEILVTLFGFDIISTNEKVLKDIKDKEIIPYILQYRAFAKKVSTYGEDFLKHIHPVTGRVHSEFLQNGTVSGRLSSMNPNLQNIPSDDNYREPFSAPDGKLLLTLDYSQQEYRLAGATSKDPIIIGAYVAGKDMHTSTAAIIFGKDIHSVTKEERSIGKTINFAVLYGSTSYGLSFNLNIDIETADKFLKLFYRGYPTLTKFKSAFENGIWKRKRSSTVMGRKRYWEDKIIFTGYRDADKYEARVKREGYNHLVQGTGADVMKLAMIKMDSENPFGAAFKLIIQIHDEIVIEVDEAIAEEAEKFAKNCMLEVFRPFLGEIPAEVGSHIGKCWAK